MIRILVYLAVVFALGVGLAWLADRPGDMVVTFEGYQYQVSLMVAAIAVTFVVAAVMITWWLLKSLWNSPYTIARYFRVRRRDRGYQALSTGMIAAGAGDAELARRMKKQAAKLISSDREPLIHLLDAQTSLLEGDRDGAREKFSAMLDDPETRLLGLRGLYLEAERAGEAEAARHYAMRAAELAPQLGWAGEASLEHRVELADWDGALKLVAAQKSARQADREALNRRRAILLTAKSMDLLEKDPAAAKAAALEATKLAPGFAPAAMAAARALFRLFEVRKGSKTLEAAWKAEPHPEIAELYVRARPGDSVMDRLTRARRLRSLKPNNVESAMAVARAALDAAQYDLARKMAKEAIRLQPRESAYLLLADIEEAESGDEGKVRQYLAMALRAPSDPGWVADGYLAEKWAPASPVTGRLDAFEWKAPVARLGKVVEPGALAEIEPPRREPPPVREAEAASKAPIVEVASEPETAPAPPAPQPQAQAPAATDDTVAAMEPAPRQDVRAAPAKRSGNGSAKAADEAIATRKGASRKADVPLSQRPPDDPGVEASEEGSGPTRRFRLF